MNSRTSKGIKKTGEFILPFFILLWSVLLDFGKCSNRRADTIHFQERIRMNVSDY